MDALPEFEIVRPQTLDALIAARAAHPQSDTGTRVQVTTRHDVPARPGVPAVFVVNRMAADKIRDALVQALKQALAEGSEFRRIIDHLDPTQTAVTFWVYPESFGVYRQLRDYCLRRDLLVAGRPLPRGVPIASSRNGSASRGQ